MPPNSQSVAAIEACRPQRCVRHGVQKRIAVSLVRNVSEFGFESLEAGVVHSSAIGFYPSGYAAQRQKPTSEVPALQPAPVW